MFTYILFVIITFVFINFIAYRLSKIFDTRGCDTIGIYTMSNCINVVFSILICTSIENILTRQYPIFSNIIFSLISIIYITSYTFCFASKIEDPNRRVGDTVGIYLDLSE